MDPILAQKTQELWSKLSKARAAGVDVTPDQIEAWLRRETGGKYGVADAQGYVASLSNTDAKNVAGSLGQGATFNFADEAAGVVSPEARDAMRLRDKAYSGAHPVKSGLLKLAGAVLSPALIAALAPEAVTGAGATGGAMLARAAAAGGVGAGAAAAGASDAPDLGGRLKAAAIPAALGTVAGPVAALASKATGALATGAGRAMTESADGAAVRNAGRMLPPDFAAQAARHEALAPGTLVPAAASPVATAMASGVGASARAAVPALEEAEARLAGIVAAKKGLKPVYDALSVKAGPLKIDNELRDILHTVGEDTFGSTVAFSHLQKLRTEFGRKSGLPGKDQHLYGEAKERLTAWLQPKVQGLDEVDSRYSFFSRAEENAEKLLKVVEDSNKNHGKNDLYGAESGSIAGHLPAAVRGMASAAAHALTVNKEGKAEAIHRTLMQPADASMVARLVASRNAAMAPRVPTPGSNFVAPAAGPSTIMTFLKMLSEPTPDQLRPEAQAQ